ncbi:MAG: hypothetical protein JNM24_15405 [Bdellovibrionaceae bacterium]|nr:hypothetical protein [Pseudobdellovibrionaceae bacterium]
MGSRKYKYFLVWKNLQIPLFESQFRFNIEDQCLKHYEKGLARGMFAFNRTGVDQVWSELALWGLIGRICPIELARILCAFGCGLVAHNKNNTWALSKSFFPVTDRSLAISQVPAPNPRRASISAALADVGKCGGHGRESQGAIFIRHPAHLAVVVAKISDA